jgi:putative membrane protein
MKTEKSTHFFESKEQEAIRDAVKSAEASTSGEIATMVVDHSDSYREAEILGGVLLAGLLAFLASLLLEYASTKSVTSEWGGMNNSIHLLHYGIYIWTYIPMVFLLFFPSKYLFRKFPVLKLSIVGRKRMEQAVRERAVRAFYEKRLYKTRDETGVLIFISLLERKVWILGDKGVDRIIPHAFWQERAVELTAGIRDNRACEALCAVIGKIGNEMEGHFPRKVDDTNELSDEIIH